MEHPVAPGSRKDARLLLVSAAAEVHRYFGTSFASLSEQAALDIIAEHLGTEVRDGAAYIVGLLPCLPPPPAAATPAVANGPSLLLNGSQRSGSPPETPTRTGSAAQQQTTPITTAPAATAAAAHPENSAAGTAISPVTPGIPGVARALLPVATVPAATAVTATVAGLGLSDEGPQPPPAGHRLLPSAPTHSRHPPISQQPSGQQQQQQPPTPPRFCAVIPTPELPDPTAAVAATGPLGLGATSSGGAAPPPLSAALLFCGMLLSDCGRGVPRLVRHLLEGGGGGEDLPQQEGPGPATSPPGGQHPHPHQHPHPRLDADAVRVFLEALVQLLGPGMAGTCALHRQQLWPLRNAVVGEMQVYDLCKGSNLPRALPGRELAASSRGPPSMLRGLLLTPEQRQVVEEVRRRTSAGQPPGVICVQAFAGTAKTTTARAVVAALRDLRVLYVVYNKDMQRQAIEDMDHDLKFHGGRRKNFQVYTSHGLARRELGYREHFGNRKNGDLSTPVVRRFLTDLWGPVGRKDLKSVVVVAVRTAVNRFMTSEDAELQLKHFSMKAKEDIVAPLQQLWQRKRQALTPDAARAEAVRAAQRLWSEILQPPQGTTARPLDVPHNAYLKRWALDQPKLASWDLIIADEAQDVNRVTRQLLLDLQTDTHILLLGDRHQQIYSFNYACGLLSGRTPIPRLVPPRLSLRQTFRFGPEIAAAVNLLLKTAYGEAGDEEGEFIVGREGQQGVVYCCLPADRDLSDVTAGDLFPPPAPPGSAPGPTRGGHAGAAGEGGGGGASGGAAAGPPRAFRFLQCPLRGAAPQEDFPAELAMTAPVPGTGAALLDPTLHPSLRPRVTLVARRNVTLVHLAVLLVAGGWTVCASFCQDREAGGDTGGGEEGGGGGEGEGGGGGGGGGRRDKRYMPSILKRMQDVYQFLRKGRRFSDSRHVLCDCESAEELAELVDAGADTDLTAAYGLVTEMLRDRPDLDISHLVADLYNKLVSDPSRADYYLTTAHKMKGRQHPIIQLAEDFVELSPTDEDGRRLLQRCRNTCGAGIDELNALYVAASRAGSVLMLNRDLSRLALGLHQQNVRLRAPEPLQQLLHLGSAATATSSQDKNRDHDQPSSADHQAGAAPFTPPPCRPQQYHEPTPGPSHQGPADIPDEGGSSGPGPRSSSSSSTDGLLHDAATAATAAAAAAAMLAAAAPAAPAAVMPPTPEALRPTLAPPASGTAAASRGLLEGVCGWPQAPPSPPSYGGVAKRVRSTGSGGDDLDLDLGHTPRPAKSPRTGATSAPQANGSAATYGGNCGIRGGSVSPGSGAEDLLPAGAAALAVAAGASAEKCPVCQLVIAGGVGDVAGGSLPAVLWRGRPLCGVCGRATVFGQVLELAAGREAAAAAAAGPAAETTGTEGTT